MATPHGVDRPQSGLMAADSGDASDGGVLSLLEFARAATTAGSPASSRSGLVSTYAQGVGESPSPRVRIRLATNPSPSFGRPIRRAGPGVRAGLATAENLGPG